MTPTRRTVAALLAALGTGFLAAPGSDAAGENQPQAPNPAASPAAFHFTVNFSGGDDADAIAFQEVSGISEEAEPAPGAEGGDNSFAHKLPKAAKHSNLVLKYGIAPPGSALLNWVDATMSASLENPVAPREILVTLKDGDGRPLRAWRFAGAFPVKISRHAASAETGETPIETLELAYTYSAREM